MQARDGGVAIPPVVARIFSGDSTSPLARGSIDVVLSEGWYSNPSVLTAKSLINQKGGCIASKNATKRQFVPCRQSTSL